MVNVIVSVGYKPFFTLEIDYFNLKTKLQVIFCFQSLNVESVENRGDRTLSSKFS